MEDGLPVHIIVAIAGFAAGIIFGGVANKTNFCTMGAVSDMVFMGDSNRFRAWMMAIGVAILGTQTLHISGQIDISSSIYLTSNFGWLGGIVGGLMFGHGMTMAGGCGNKTLVRIGGGNLKSIVVAIIMGIFAYMTLRGLLGLARIELEKTNIDLSETSKLETQSMVEMVARMINAETESIRLTVALVIAGAILLYVFKSAEFRSSPTDMAAGLIIGLMIPAGWWITGVLGLDDFDPTPLFSFTFVSPTADSLQYLMTFTGATINFGIATVAGVIVGSFLVAISSKSFHIESFSDKSDMIRHMIGAAIMGIGGILALGCTVGQGITGMSTLSLGSVIALLSILFGALWGLKSLEEDSIIGGLKAACGRG
ncbi:MAG: YeeE/YedE family protein [Rhodospirillaceae bacterium]|nr:YeeE/YedE family protein [Rhodospirillaceae bacterium]